MKVTTFNDDSVKKFRISFYSYYFLLTSAIPLLFANTSRFIMFQIVKEKELQIFSTLSTLNVSSHAYALSFLVIQSFYSLYAALITTIACIPMIQENYQIPLFFVTAFLFGEALICFSLAVSTFFNDSKFSTQIGFLTLFTPIFIYMAIEVFLPID